MAPTTSAPSLPRTRFGPLRACIRGVSQSPGADGAGALVDSDAAALLGEPPEIQRLRINADGSRSITWARPGFSGQMEQGYGFSPVGEVVIRRSFAGSAPPSFAFVV